MSFNTQDKYEICKRAWLEASRRCGGVTAISKLLKVTRSTVNDWINKPNRKIPYEYAVFIAEKMQISIERLSPFTEVANEIFRNLPVDKQLSSIEMSLNKIIIADFHYLQYSKQDQSIYVDSDGTLISGLSQLETYKVAKKQNISVVFLDIEALALGIKTINEIKRNFLISERIAIGLRLEQMLSGRQGQRSDLGKGRKNQKINGNKSQHRGICTEVIGRTDSKIAEIIGLASRETYKRAKKVYYQGIPDLIEALDRKEISIAKAARIAELSSSTQEDFIQATNPRRKLS